jgi:hypothetical protein
MFMLWTGSFKSILVHFQVSVGRRPVTGIRLCLEGRKFNKLAVHLQHLTSTPLVLRPSWENYPSSVTEMWKEPDREERRWFEPVMWKSFAHVNTCPIELSESWIGEATGAFIVTGAQLQVWGLGLKKKVLFLKLLYTKVPGCSIRRSVWDHAPAAIDRPGLLYNLGLGGPPQKPDQAPVLPNAVNQDSAIFPRESLSSPVNSKLLKYVDISEMCKGPAHTPGHWLVTGAKLDLDTGKIGVRVKYSLLHYTGGHTSPSSFSRSSSTR